jgi:hypothetical protein
VMVECKTNPASVPRTTVRGRVNGQGHGNGTLGASRASGDSAVCAGSADEVVGMFHSKAYAA